jgi:hypothetical protein
MWLSNLKFVAEKIFPSDIHIAARGGRNCNCGNHNRKYGEIKTEICIQKNSDTSERPS